MLACMLACIAACHVISAWLYTVNSGVWPHARHLPLWHMLDAKFDANNQCKIVSPLLEGIVSLYLVQQ